MYKEFEQLIAKHAIDNEINISLNEISIIARYLKNSSVSITEFFENRAEYLRQVNGFSKIAERRRLESGDPNAHIESTYDLADEVESVIDELNNALGNIEGTMRTRTMTVVLESDPSLKKMYESLLETLISIRDREDKALGEFWAMHPENIKAYGLHEKV